ncbi:hypothetical protein BH20ACT6_BH20ACT6_22350 [soil metagenome]
MRGLGPGVAGIALLGLLTACTTTTGPSAPEAAPTPSGSAPSSDRPSSDRPSTDLPSTDLPSTDLPSTDLPSTDRPGTDRPGTGGTVRGLPGLGGPRIGVESMLKTVSASGQAGRAARGSIRCLRQRRCGGRSPVQRLRLPGDPPAGSSAGRHLVGRAGGVRHERQRDRDTDRLGPTTAIPHRWCAPRHRAAGAGCRGQRLRGRRAARGGTAGRAPTATSVTISVHDYTGSRCDRSSAARWTRWCRSTGSGSALQCRSAPVAAARYACATTCWPSPAGWASARPGARTTPAATTGRTSRGVSTSPESVARPCPEYHSPADRPGVPQPAQSAGSRR